MPFRMPRSSALSSMIARALIYTPVSYTHLDVYKRQADLGVEGRVAVLDHELGEAADIVKRLKRWLVLLVEQLHELVGLYEHSVGLRLRKREDLSLIHI